MADDTSASGVGKDDPREAFSGKYLSDTPTEKTAPEFLGDEQFLMKINKQAGQEGAMGYVLLWLLGIPVPVLLLFFLLRGCT